MRRLKAWIASDPEVRVAQMLLLLIVLRLAAGWFVLAVVLWLVFRACRWIGRKFCFDSRYSNYAEWEFCGDARWPRGRVTRLWDQVLA